MWPKAAGPFQLNIDTPAEVGYGLSDRLGFAQNRDDFFSGMLFHGVRSSVSIWDAALSLYVVLILVAGQVGGSSHRIKGDYRYYFYRCAKADDGQCNCYTIICHAVDDKVWDWLLGMLSDEDVLDAGLKRMAKRAEEELEPKRVQLQDTVSLIGKAENKIKRLSAFIADTEDATALEALKANLHSATRERAALVAEKIVLEKDLGQRELTTDTQNEIKQAVSNIRKRLKAASYTDKRYIFEKLGLRVKYCVDGNLRWLEVKCGIAPNGAMLNIENTHSERRAA